MSTLTEENLIILQEAYEKDCVPIIELAKWAGITRQGLWKAFRKNGVETRKGKATRRTIKCDHCGKDYEITRGRYRDQVLKGGAKKHFCSDNCYFLYLENPDSATNRHKQRIARKKVAEVFDLKDEHIVHHADGNHFNTMLENFMVFENQSDHIKHHHELRQGEILTFPIWDGGGGPLKKRMTATEVVKNSVPELCSSGFDTIPEKTDAEILAAGQKKIDALRKEQNIKNGNVEFNPQPKTRPKKK